MEGQISHRCSHRIDILAGSDVKGDVSTKDMLLTLEV